MLRCWGLLAAVVLATGCDKPTFNDHVPAAAGGTCKVSVGDVKSHVRIRCGGPCNSGAVPEGTCADGREGACENVCDVYQDVEVCYLNDRVISVSPIDREFGRFSWCFWPQPEPEPRRRSRTP